MSYAKKIIVLAALVLAVAQKVQSRTHLGTTCMKLKQEILRNELSEDIQKILELASEYLYENDISGEGDKLLEAWDAVLKDQECSPSSIEYLLLIAACEPNGPLEFLERPSKAYAQKCFVPANLSQKLKSAISHDFVSREFIRKYGEENPFRPAVNLQYRSQCCKSFDSISAIVDAINLDYLKRGKNTKELSLDGKRIPNALKDFLNDKLLRPCRQTINSNAKFVYYLRQAARLYFGGDDELIATLDQEAKDSIFRFQYCADMSYDESFMTNVALEI